jgi:hypothetical protein
MKAHQRIKTFLCVILRMLEKANTPMERMNILKEASMKIFKWKSANKTFKPRMYFVKNKYFKRLFRNDCYVCKRRSQVRHHIIPLSHGGDNRDRNIIALCEWCHSQIHPWIKSDPPTENYLKSLLIEEMETPEEVMIQDSHLRGIFNGHL